MFVYSDGGRKASGFKGEARDCACRAIAIASGRPYEEVYRELAAANRATGACRSARNGVSKKALRGYLADHNWTWKPTMFIGSGCKVHLRASELPPGRLICSVSKHLVAVIDGVVYDTHDPSRDGTRCVYGYWFIK